MLFRKSLVDSDGDFRSAFRICVRAYQVLIEVMPVVFVTAVTVLATSGVELVQGVTAAAPAIVKCVPAIFDHR